MHTPPSDEVRISRVRAALFVNVSIKTRENVVPQALSEVRFPIVYFHCGECPHLLSGDISVSRMLHLTILPLMV